MKWNNKTTGEKAQFVVNLFRESLFDFAFDSDKVPTLNLHFFCKDYFVTSNLIDESIFDEGNIIPLNEEFEYIINHSAFLPQGVSSALFWTRNKKGYFEKIDFKEEDGKKRKHYQENAKYVYSLLSANTTYIGELISTIISTLRKTTWGTDEKSLIYFCVREFICELVNLGFNKKYIYNQTSNKFNYSKKSQDDIAYIENFLNSLLRNEEDYSVVIGITDEVYKELSKNLTGARKANEKEKSAINAEYVIQTETTAVDSFSALNKAKNAYSLILSIYNACCHNTELKILPKGLVALKSNNNFSLVDDSKNLMSKNLNKTISERRKWMHIAVSQVDETNLLTAFELHNSALAIDDTQSQFLNLWTIIELLIKTNQKMMSRINFISNILCSILCNIYYKRIIVSLLKRIYNKFSATAQKIIKAESRGNTDEEKLAYILKDNSTLQLQLINAVALDPLLVYKIEYYSKKIFISKEVLKEDFVRHSNRIRWQIMRIYRNRCFIVHDGECFDYMNSTLENLHYYVDEMFNYIFEKLEYGITDLESIFTFARVKEKEKLEILGTKSSLSDDDFYKVIFDC